LRFIENIIAMTSSFLAAIPIGFFTHCSKSTTKYSGIILRISLFGRSTQFLAISKALSTSSGRISSHEIATVPLLVITSKLDELNERNAHEICSHAIFSASSKDLSRLSLNSSISKIFHFRIALDDAIQIPRTWNEL
jgi:hypothetical protein